MQRYRGTTFVIKYGGSFMDAPDPLPHMREIARDILFLHLTGIKPVIVHGGGKAITRAMEQAGLKPKFVSGLRVTDQATVRIVENVLSHQINPQIVQTLTEVGGAAVGFSGTQVFKCIKATVRTATGECIDPGFVGEVTAVDTQLIQQTLQSGTIPVISPTAIGPDQNVYNCNADVAAAQTAIALKARRLIYMTDVPGLMRDPKDPGTLIPHLAVAEVQSLKNQGVIASGMIPKVDSAVAAVRAGVEKVSFIDARMPHSILLEIFTDAGVGTEIVL